MYYNVAVVIVGRIVVFCAGPGTGRAVGGGRPARRLVTDLGTPQNVATIASALATFGHAAPAFWDALEKRSVIERFLVRPDGQAVASLAAACAMSGHAALAFFAAVEERAGPARPHTKSPGWRRRAPSWAQVARPVCGGGTPRQLGGGPGQFGGRCRAGQGLCHARPPNAGLVYGRFGPIRRKWMYSTYADDDEDDKSIEKIRSACKNLGHGSRSLLKASERRR
jgi:hypothetical protein